MAIPFKQLGLREYGPNAIERDDFIFDFKFKVASIYEKASGKYGQAFGNAAFVDCNNLGNALFNAILRQLDKDWFESEAQYQAVVSAVTAIREKVSRSGVTACGLAMEIDAMLTNEASYYMGDTESITKLISSKGNEIMSVLGQ